MTRMLVRLSLALMLHLPARSQQPQAVTSGPASQKENRERAVADVVKSSLDAVVLIVVSDSSGNEVKQGSGFIISPDGKILTNNHVIDGGQKAIAKLTNGAYFPVESVLAVDKDFDLALIKVSGKGLPALALGNAENLSIGDHVIAIGSPLGLQNTVSDGIVSAIREESTGRKWIQTTAPVSPGNSGGPLLTLKGEVAGIVTFRVKEGESLNFAVPANAAKILLTSVGKPVLFGTAVPSRPAESQITNGEGIWTSMVSGRDYKVRIEGEYVYVEWVNLPPQLRGTAAFARDELKRTGNIWAGKGRSYLPCTHKSAWSGAQEVHWCSLEADMEITSISQSRIEGRAQAFVEFDCKKCLPKKIEWRSFSWIPKE